MPTSLEITLAGKILGQSIQDLYNSGKERFSDELAKWKNSASHTQLARRLAKLQKVKTFWQRDKEVSLYSFFYPSPIIFSESVKKEIAGLSEFPQTGNFVIQGTVGQGKSIFLRHLCAQELGDKGSGRIPVFIELRHVKAQGVKPLIYDALDSLGFEINDRLFEFYANSSKIVLVLDGFDEIEETLIAQTIKELEKFSEKHENLQIIVSSRPSSAIQNSRHFRVVRLAPLTHDDHPKFLRKISLSGIETDKLLKAIAGSSAAINGLLTTPLMMTLLVVVYRAENSIPTELPEFFERLFQTLFSKHDSIKPGLPKRHRSGLSERKLQSLFEAFCFAVLQLKKKTTLSSTDFNKCFEQAKKLSGSDCNEDHFKHDISKAVCLMQEEGFDLHFIHKSVLEFFAASFVRGLNDEAATKFYSQMGKSWKPWSQVIAFLSQIDTYRYSLDFAIPNLELALSQLGIDPENPRDFDLNSAMDVALKGVELCVRGSSSGANDVYAVNTPISWNYFLDRRDDCILGYVFSKGFSPQGKIPLSINEVDVNWKQALSFSQYTRLKEIYKDYFSELISNLQRAKEVIKAEGNLVDMIKI